MKFTLALLLTLMSLPVFAGEGLITQAELDQSLELSDEELAKRLDEKCEIEEDNTPQSFLNENVKLVSTHSKLKNKLSAIEKFVQLANLRGINSAKNVMDQFGVSAHVAYRILENTRAMTSSDEAKVVQVGGGDAERFLTPYKVNPCIRKLMRDLLEKSKHLEMHIREIERPVYEFHSILKTPQEAYR